MSATLRSGVGFALSQSVVESGAQIEMRGARRLLPYQQKFGFSPHSLVALSDDATAWESRRSDGAVAYLRVGKTWLASEPLAGTADLLRVTQEFLEFAMGQEALACFIPVTSRFASFTAALELDCTPIGMSPYFDVMSWNTSGRRAHGLRSGIRQAERAGVTVEQETPNEHLSREIEALAETWSANRRSALFGWVFAPDGKFIGYKKLFTARDAAGKLAAFATASPMPARDSYYLEDIQRDPGAPRGTTDVLFASAMKSLREEGAGSVTLGTVPLMGMDRQEALRRGMYPIVRKGLNLLATHGESVYNFAGVHTFKSRLSPSWWEHEYAVVPAGRFLSGPRAGFAALRAILPAGIVSTIFGTNSSKKQGSQNQAHE